MYGNTFFLFIFIVFFLAVLPIWRLIIYALKLKFLGRRRYDMLMKLGTWVVLVENLRGMTPLGLIFKDFLHFLKN